MAAILLGTQTQLLLRDIFQGENFSVQCHRIVRRTVLWGEATSPVTLPHQGLVVSERFLLDQLWPLVPHCKQEAQMTPDRERFSFSLHTTPPGDDSSDQFVFGERNAQVRRVSLRSSTHNDECMIESTPHGWLFLLPAADGLASLISVSIDASLPEQLGASRLITDAVDSLLPSQETAIFSCAPRLAHALASESWLRCGSAAMSFDPVCGEGAGNALRESFLAAAVIHAMLSGEPIERLMTHYSSRLIAGFLRHLEHCRSFYATGGSHEFWRTELAALEDGIVRVRSLLSNMPPASYRLDGFRLKGLYPSSI
jgi:hypothetical protein